jgi:alpha-glucosidase
MCFCKRVGKADDRRDRQKRTRRWMDGGIVYQIYPRSWQDADGDGVGDLAGIIRRLDYLRDLGVQAIWLSPFYPSPMADFGYDIADYCNVDPLFGTLDDFRRLLSEAQRRDIKVLIDLVPNHTSDQHPWFVLSRMSRSSPYASWYVWRDPSPGSLPGKPQPPNNWRDALSGGPAWEWDEGRQQFYLHSFNKHQPDLNWSNPAVREAIREVMRFWLDVGVDGFRVDAVYWMAKDPLLRNDLPNPDYVEGRDPPYDALVHTYSQGWPGLYGYLAAMADVLAEEPYKGSERFMVTEAYPPQHNAVTDYLLFYAAMDPKVAAPFNFEGLMLPWRAAPWRQFLQTFHRALAELSPLCVASYAFGNHDQRRLVSRLGVKAARAAAVMQFTLPGVIFVYYGEELGMHDVPIPSGRVRDPAAVGDPGHMGRDPARTPMQWTNEPGAGFSSGEPWLPLAADYAANSVAAEEHEPASFLLLYRTLAHWRAQSEALRHGDIEVVNVGAPHVLAYRRHKGNDRMYTFINFANRPVRLSGLPVRKLVVSSDPQSQAGDTALDGTIQLLPHEGALFVE